MEEPLNDFFPRGTVDTECLQSDPMRSTVDPISMSTIDASSINTSMVASEIAPSITESINEEADKSPLTKLYAEEQP